MAALDEAGLNAQGAAWIYDHSLEEWRFVVATSLVETMGRTAVYGRLLSVMARLKFPEELTIDDVHLISTDQGLYMGLGRAFRIENAIVRLNDCIINGRKFDAVIYRWGAQLPTKNEKVKTEKQFVKRTKELAR